MEFKGTKENWHIQKHYGERISVHAGEYKSICDVWGKSVSYVTNEEMEANAKLIAASPMMLKALQSFVDDFESDYVLDGKVVDNPCNILVVNYHEFKEVINQSTE